MNRIARSVVLLVLLAVGAGARGIDFEARLQAARTAFLHELEGYVAWTQANNLFLERQKAYELVLEIDPSHAEARKMLGYTRQKDGSWKPPPKPKTFTDFDKKALAEAPARWSTVTGTFVAAMLALLESGELDPEQKAAAAREALRFDPDNARVHAVLGDVHSEKGWVLPETVRAQAQREVLRGQVRAALEGTPDAQPAALNEREKGYGLPLSAVAAPGVRVVGTADAQELLLTAKAVLAVESLMRAVFESKHGLPDDTTVFMLASPEDRKALLAKHPAVTEANRAAYDGLEGASFQGTNDFAYWTGDTQHRIDGIVRLTLGYWLSGAFEITIDQGWAYEGLGLYLTRSLVRTRMTWLAQPAVEKDHAKDIALRQKLLDPATNWMDESLRLLQEGHSTPLLELFKKRGSELTTEDVLLSYTLATYLLEVRPDGLAAMLKRMGGGAPRAQSFQQLVGMDLAAFERHLTRWLSERS